MRNYLNDEIAKQRISQADDILKKSHDAEYIKKVLAVQSALKGVSTSEIANCFHVTERIIQIWIKKTMEKGFPELQRKAGSGRPKKLNSDQLFEISDWLDYESPSSYEPDAQEWTGTILTKAIKIEFNVDISPKWCSNFIRNGMYKVRTIERQKNYRIVDKLREENSNLRKENSKLKTENRELLEKLNSNPKRKSRAAE